MRWMSSLSPSQHVPWLCAPEPSQVWPSCLLWQSRPFLSGKGLSSLFFLALSYFPGPFVPVPAPPFPQGFSLFLQMVAHLLPQPQSPSFYKAVPSVRVKTLHLPKKPPSFPLYIGRQQASSGCSVRERRKLDFPDSPAFLAGQFAQDPLTCDRSDVPGPPVRGNSSSVKWVAWPSVGSDESQVTLPFSIHWPKELALKGTHSESSTLLCVGAVNGNGFEVPSTKHRSAVRRWQNAILLVLDPAVVPVG